MQAKDNAEESKAIWSQGKGLSSKRLGRGEARMSTVFTSKDIKHIGADTG